MSNNHDMSSKNNGIPLKSKKSKDKSRNLSNARILTRFWRVWQILSRRETTTLMLIEFGPANIEVDSSIFAQFQAKIQIMIIMIIMIIIFFTFNLIFDENYVKFKLAILSRDLSRKFRLEKCCNLDKISSHFYKIKQRSCNVKETSSKIYKFH